MGALVFSGVLPARLGAQDAPAQPKAAPPPVDRPATVRPDPAVAPASDQRPELDPTTQPPKASQFSAANANPTGMALGVLDKSVDDQGLPAELEEVSKEGALASADQDWNRAATAYEKMIQLAPRNALAYANLGIVEYRRKNFEAARTALRRSLQLNPSISQNWLTLGLVYHQEQSYELAIASLARALHQDPKDPRAHLYMAVVIHDYGWGSAAETELQRAIEIDPNYADAHFNLALMYLEKDPPAIELARRHYYLAKDLGAPPDTEVEKRVALKESMPAKLGQGAASAAPAGEPEKSKPADPAARNTKNGP
jgi:tetratricopeptide (TPR) repeat protein